MRERKLNMRLIFEEHARKSPTLSRLTSNILHIIDIYYHTALFIYAESYLGSIFFKLPI